MDLAQCGLKRSIGKMEQYKDLGCGNNVPLENCKFYQYKLKQNPNDISWQTLMDTNKCRDLLNDNLTSNVKGVIDTYSDYDKNRIEAESKYQRNIKIFIGGMVFLTVIGIFLTKQK
jgi:hypothetical protein